jgi:hypothetical protein
MMSRYPILTIDGETLESFPVGRDAAESWARRPGDRVRYGSNGELIVLDLFFHWRAITKQAQADVIPVSWTREELIP